MGESHAALSHLEVILRLLVALGCGAAIGLNREFHRKPAGFRTFGLVSIGAALVVLLMELEPHSGPDAVSRVVQGVLTGIGFLGAGVIFRRDSHKQVGGLTTAAAVWLTAGLGMAAGAGQFVVAIGGAVLGLALLLLGGPLERLLTRRGPRDPDRDGNGDNGGPDGESQ
jgi:putative Mg2+ transporter-C (MgtC) family protein